MQKKENQKKIILDLCGGTGSWSSPWAEAGYDVRLITLPEYDVRKAQWGEQEIWFPNESDSRFANKIDIADIVGILAAPPCTEFSIAKNRNIKRKLKKGMEVVDACMRVIEVCRPKWWALENPAGLLHTFLGKPKMTFQPWWYGDPWTKKTMVWGWFRIPERQWKKWEDVPKNAEMYIRPGRKKPAMASFHKSAQAIIPQIKNFKVDDDAAFRAITPPGFARAFFEANQ